MEPPNRAFLSRTSQPDSQSNRGGFSKQCIIAHSVVWLEVWCVHDHYVKLELSVNAGSDMGAGPGILQTVFLGVKELGGLLPHLSSMITLWEMLIDRNTSSASTSSTPVSGGAPMWKEQQIEGSGESWEEHGSSGLCHEILPSTAPHDMAG